MGVYSWLKKSLECRKPDAQVLVYHRVADLEFDPQCLAVSQRNFREQMDCIRKEFLPVALCDLVEMLGRRNIPKKTIAVTFDDGYADNLYQAIPILQEYGITATVFVTTGYLTRDREFWWDELEQIVFEANVLPEVVRIPGPEGLSALAFKEGGVGQDVSPARKWSVLDDDDPTPRHRFFRELSAALRPLGETERDDVLAQLRSGCDPHLRETHRPLLADELSQLGDCDLIEIGSHTVTHPVLAGLSAKVQDVEIAKSKEWLENILGKEVRSFAYPYGWRSSYTDKTIDLVREAKYAFACANIQCGVSRRSDPYQLPRRVVRNWGGEEFMHHMKRWMDT